MPKKKRFSYVYQFKVVLKGAPLPIWRRILIPDNYNFWDFHVAIQDAMEWLDEHLHHFILKNPITQKKAFIEMERDDLDDLFIGLPHSKRQETYLEIDQYVANWFTPHQKKGLYVYDFGDNWEHELTLEKILPKEKGAKYPRCIAGKGACPPENCGGVYGYEQLLKILKDPKHPEYQELYAWLMGQGIDPQNFDPHAFDPVSVEFDDPKERWEEMLAWKEM